VARRAEFEAQAQAHEPRRLIFLDEAGSHVGLTRTHARGPRGHRVRDRVPRNRGRVLTMIGALTVLGLQALMTVEGGTTAEVFLRFVRDHLVPLLQPGDLVVMDNLGAHHAKGVRDAIEATGARVLYMPPYSPDLNPIELAWSKLKSILRRMGARTPEALRRAVHEAASLIDHFDALGWFHHCGYDAHSD